MSGSRVTREDAMHATKIECSNIFSGSRMTREDAIHPCPPQEQKVNPLPLPPIPIEACKGALLAIYPLPIRQHLHIHHPTILIVRKDRVRIPIRLGIEISSQYNGVDVKPLPSGITFSEQDLCALGPGYGTLVVEVRVHE